MRLVPVEEEQSQAFTLEPVQPESAVPVPEEAAQRPALTLEPVDPVPFTLEPVDEERTRGTGIFGTGIRINVQNPFRRSPEPEIPKVELGENWQEAARIGDGQFAIMARPPEEGEVFRRVTGHLARAALELPAGIMDYVSLGAREMDKFFGQEWNPRDVSDMAMARNAEALRRSAEAAFPTNREMQNSFLLDTVPQAIGSFGAFIAGGIASRAARASPMVFSLLAATGMGSSHSYREAKASGADEETAQIAGRWGVIPGAIQVFPVVRALDRFDRSSGGQMRRSWLQYLKEGGKGALEEWIVESAGQVGFNKIAEQYYDEDREWLDGVVESGAAGGVAGFMASFLLSAAGGRVPRSTLLRVADQNNIEVNLDGTAEQIAQEINNVLAERAKSGAAVLEWASQMNATDLGKAIVHEAETVGQGLDRVKDILGEEVANRIRQEVEQPVPPPDSPDVVPTALPDAPVEYLGYQEGTPAVPGVHMWNLTQDIDGHTQGSTITTQTMRRLGYLEEGGPAESRESAIARAQTTERAEADAIEIAEQGSNPVERMDLETPMLSDAEIRLFEAELQSEIVDTAVPVERGISAAMNDLSNTLSDFAEVELTINESRFLENEYRKAIGASLDVSATQEAIIRERAKADTRARGERETQARRRQALLDRIEQLKSKHEQTLRRTRRNVDVRMAEQRLRAEERLGRETQRRLKEVQRRYRERRDLGQAIGDLEALVRQMPTEIRGRFQGFGTLSGIVSQEAQQRFLNRASERVLNLIDDFTVRTNRAKLQSLIQRNTPTRRTRKNLAHRIDVGTQRTFQKIKDIAQLDRDQVSARRNQILEGYDAEAEAGLPESQREDLFLLNVFGARANPKETPGFTGEEMRRAVEEYEYILREGRTRKQAEQEAYAEIIEAKLGEAMRALVPKGKGLKSAPQLRMQQQSFFNQVRERIAAEANRQQSFEWLLDTLTRDDSPQLQGALQEFFVRQHIAQNRKWAAIEERTNALNDYLHEVYGVESDRKLARILDANSQMVEESSVTFAKEDGTREQYPMSVNQGISAWMQLQDQSLEPTFEGMGWDQTTRQELEAFIGEEGIAVGEWLLEHYDGGYDGINAVHSRVEGFDLPRVDRYSPTRREHQPDIDDPAFLKQNTLRATVKNNSLIERTNNVNPLVFDDAFNVFERHTALMEHYKHFADWSRDARRVFWNPDVQRAIDQFNGRETRGILERYIEDIINGGVTDMQKYGLIDNARRFITTARLALKPSIFLKQLTSIPAYMNDVPAGQYVQLLAEYWANPIQNAENLYNSSTYLQERMSRGYERDVRDVMRRLGKRRFTQIRTWRDRAMFLTRMGDMGAIFQGGWPVYQYHKNRLLGEGKTPEAAHEEAITLFEMATNRSQQSSRLDSMSQYQRQNAITKLFTTYMTAPASYMRLELAAMRNLARGRITPAQAAKQMAIYHFVLPNLFQLASNAFHLPFFVEDEDRAAEFWRRHLRASVVGSFNGFLIYGDWFESLIDVLSGGPAFMADQNLPLYDQVSRVIRQTPAAVDEVSKAGYFVTGEEEPPDFRELLRLSAPSIEVLTGIPANTLAEFWRGLELISEGDREEEAFWRFMGYGDYSRAEHQRSRREATGTRLRD